MAEVRAQTVYHLGVVEEVVIMVQNQVERAVTAKLESQFFKTLSMPYLVVSLNNVIKNIMAYDRLST
jgi:hypothetical protein